MKPIELQDYLRKTRLSPQEFAALVGVTKGAVMHWLNGRREIPLTIIKLIDYFELNIRDFGGKHESGV